MSIFYTRLLKEKFLTENFLSLVDIHKLVAWIHLPSDCLYSNNLQSKRQVEVAEFVYTVSGWHKIALHD